MKGRSSVVLSVTVVVVAVIAASTVIAVVVEDHARATGLIVPLVGLVPVLIGFLTVVAKLDGITDRVDQVDTQVTAAVDQVDRLANGEGSAKIRGVVAEVLRDDLVDPKALETLEADRRSRLAAEATARVLADRQRGDL